MVAWQEEQIQAIRLGIELLILITFAAFLVYFTRLYLKRKMRDAKKMAQMQAKHQQQLLIDSIKTQEKERERIAADLHDDLISQLNIIVLSNQENLKEKTTKLVQKSIETARRISHDLHPPLLEQASLPELLSEHLQNLQNAFLIDYHTSVHEDPNLATAFKLQILRIFQEVVNNILKHAYAQHIEIRMRITSQSIAFFISDNGIGFNEKIDQNGLGIRSIKMRTELLNGKVKIKSTLGKGSRFIFSLPIEKESIYEYEN